MTDETRKPGNEPGSDSASMLRHVRIEAPADLDPFVLAQAIIGTEYILKAERRETIPFKHHVPLAELSTETKAYYGEQIARMLSALEAHIDGIVKARSPRPLFTTKQLAELAQIIRDYHTGLAIGLLGDEIALPAEVKRLAAIGAIPKKALNILDDAFTYGQLLAEIRVQIDKGTASVPKMTLAQIRGRIKRRPIPLTTTEQYAKTWAKQQAAALIRGLGNRVSTDFETIALETDAVYRRKYQQMIRDAAQENIERRETWRKLKSDLGHRSGDWARDFSRIAATEKTRAMQEGFSQALQRREGDPENIYVAKIPTPDACEHCVRLHLKSGRGSKPRVFRLSELQDNGTNVGRRAPEWRAVVGPTHPWCECVLVHVPEGWGFDATGNLIPSRTRKAWTLERDLRKALSYTDGVPETGISIRVADPEKLAAIERVIARTPKALFHRKNGVTLITTDHPNQNSHLEEHDLAYWTGNEIRLMQTLPLDRVERVMEHELGHATNVYLVGQLGDVEKVKAWHQSLYDIAKKEGFVSDYAKELPIENAAEVTRLYLYERPKLMLDFPKQFSFVHKHYRKLLRPDPEPPKVIDRAETRLVPQDEDLDEALRV